jgi:hypothetical protein
MSYIKNFRSPSILFDSTHVYNIYFGVETTDVKHCGQIIKSGLKIARNSLEYNVKVVVGHSNSLVSHFTDVQLINSRVSAFKKLMPLFQYAQ